MIDNNNFLIIAHRGASKLAPENTIKAFQKAIELKADFIELDIQETKDGMIAVTHDEDIFRITGHHGLIKDLELKELKKFDFGQGETIPTLEETLEIIKGNIGLNCEIKTVGIANKVINLFKKYEIEKSVIVSSFIHDELLKIQKLGSKIKLASLEPTQFGKSYKRADNREKIQFCIDHDLFAINPHYTLVNEGFVTYAHENNIKIFPWTVDSKPRMRKLIALGVDGIITNDVEKLKQVLKN